MIPSDLIFGLFQAGRYSTERGARSTAKSERLPPKLLTSCESVHPNKGSSQKSLSAKKLLHTHSSSSDGSCTRTAAISEEPFSESVPTPNQYHNRTDALPSPPVLPSASSFTSSTSLSSTLNRRFAVIMASLHLQLVLHYRSQAPEL
ncbi:hypothetical protein PM082_001796 [Marasmius tenuissimus]|nr:hypothetical protein PM082_001796 [Marasmius tenuissimus]